MTRRTGPKSTLPPDATLYPMDRPRPDLRELHCVHQNQCLRHASDHEIHGFACGNLLDPCQAFRRMLPEDLKNDQQPLLELLFHIRNDRNVLYPPRIASKDA